MLIVLFYNSLPFIGPARYKNHSRCVEAAREAIPRKHSSCCVGDVLVTPTRSSLKDDAYSDLAKVSGPAGSLFCCTDSKLNELLKTVPRRGCWRGGSLRLRTLGRCSVLLLGDPSTAKKPFEGAVNAGYLAQSGNTEKFFNDRGFYVDLVRRYDGMVAVG